MDKVTGTQMNAANTIFLPCRYPTQGRLLFEGGANVSIVASITLHIAMIIKIKLFYIMFSMVNQHNALHESTISFN